MIDTLLLPLLISIVAGSATLIGLAMVIYGSNFVKRYSFSIVSLAAGVLLGTAFFHILPEAAELTGDKVFLWILLGFALFFVIEALVGFHACKEEEVGHLHVLGPVAGLGIFFHSLIDGIAIGIGFEIDVALGLVTAIAVMIHELPEGIFTLSILLHSGMKLKKAVLWTSLVALATPFGTLITLLLVPELSEESLGLLLALAGGSFLYIAASDLIPESHKSRSLTTAAFMILGLVIMFVISTI